MPALRARAAAAEAARARALAGAKKLLPWFDGMLAADEEYFKAHGEPLFSSHMLDLSEEPDEENIAICETV